MKAVFLAFLSLSLIVSTYQYSLYDLAVQVHKNFSQSGPAGLPQLHLIRVPKASSSSLSMVARRLAGCDPPGPCCRWPGDPPGSCPAKGLYDCEVQRKVIGCTHHHPNYHLLLDKGVFSMTALRDPLSRTVSAYGYGGQSSIHFNSKCTPRGAPQCIEGYISSDAWANVAVKLLCGKYAYADAPTCRAAADCACSLQLATANMDKLHFLGITELWQISLLVLHSKLKSFPPMAHEFVAGDHNTSSVEGSALLGLRISNSNSSRSQSLLAHKDELRRRNALDIELYQSAVQRLCADLHALDLWRHSIVRQHWWQNTRYNVSAC